MFTAAGFTGAVIPVSVGDVTQAVLLNLGSNTTYHFRIQALNAAGLSDGSWLVLRAGFLQAIDAHGHEVDVVFLAAGAER